MPAALRLLSLRFRSDDLEQAFRADYARRSLLLVRWALVLGLAQYAGFGLLDRWLVPSSLFQVQAIRAVVCLSLIAGIAYTYAPSFLRRMQQVVPLLPLVGGLGVVAMVHVAQTADGYYQYYVGLTLILIYVHVLLRLRFVAASTVGAVLIAAYFAVALAQETPPYLLANNVFYLCSANLSGMVASYALERYARHAFVHAREQAQSNAELHGVLEGLRTAQSRLVQQEKLASLGRVTAGVAHEIKNPLNFVNNFADLSVELLDELEGAVVRTRTALALPDDACVEVQALMEDLRHNVTKIHEHGHRADGIVRGMLEHTRSGAGSERRPVALNALVEEYATLAHHSARAQGRAVPVVVRDLDAAVGEVTCAPQEIGRLVQNLLSNAFYAVTERAAALGDADGYLPTVTVRTRRLPEAVAFEVADNGAGIPEAARERVFEPFFTTKPAGRGTGLGLSLAYDIAAGHGGSLAFESASGEGTTFIVTLPVSVSVAPAAAPVAALA